jgi:hypothetical protein
MYMVSNGSRSEEETDHYEDADEQPEHDENETDSGRHEQLQEPRKRQG